MNERNYYGGSALIVATLHNHTEIVEYLLRKKADVNAKTNKGYSSLHVAAKNGFTTVTQILIDKGMYCLLAFTFELFQSNDRVSSCLVVANFETLSRIYRTFFGQE